MTRTISEPPTWPAYSIDAWSRLPIPYNRTPTESDLGYVTYLRTDHGNGKFTQVGVVISDYDLAHNDGVEARLNLITCRLDAARLCLEDTMKSDEVVV
jgi:hypothetical protein